MHSSFFDYNISRPYPFKWLTPVVLIGGAIAFILLSILNLALTYTLTDVLQKTNEANQTLSSLVYHNNILSNCTIDHIAVRLESLGRTATQITLSDWGVDAQAYISCSLDTYDQGLTTFSLTADYNFIPDTVSAYSGFYTFVGRNETAKASLYWGESLLSMYSLHIGRDMRISDIIRDEQRISKAVITFTSGNLSTTDFRNLDFFSVLSRFVSPKPDNTWVLSGTESMPNMSSNDSMMSFWTSVDAFAKSLHSTILTDLGQNSTYPNILTDAILLEHFTSNFSSFIPSGSGSVAGPAIGPFSTRNTTGPLGINPSVLAATYLCAVPRKKPTGTLIVSVLVADLVFLQALWVLFKLAMEVYVTRKDKRANVCEGCLERKELLDDSDEVPLRPIQVSRDGDYESVSINSRQNLLA